MTYRPASDVLIKPAGPNCNLACEYCFYREKEQQFPEGKMRMSEAVLEKMIAQLMAQPVKYISFGWQGGEPTLMGIAFYRKALGLMEQYGQGQSVANGLQTNGLLVNRQSADSSANTISWLACPSTGQGTCTIITGKTGPVAGPGKKRSMLRTCCSARG